MADKKRKYEGNSIKASTFADFILGELDHPNRMPFQGIMTYFDSPSDNAPHGSGGRKVLIPSDVGVPALEGLIGMAVNFIPDTMDGHNPSEKVGVITSYEVGDRLEDGSLPVWIAGFIYAFDFPELAMQIKENCLLLGFSYETAKTILEDGVFAGERVAIVSQLVFTGASILLKSAAAYGETSLVASKEEQEGNQVEETIKELLEAVQAVNARIDAIADEFNAKLEAFAKSDEASDAANKELDDVEDMLDGADAKEDESEEKEENVQAEADDKNDSEDEKDDSEEKSDEEGENLNASKDEEEKETEEEQKEETELNAATIKAEIEALKAENARLKAEAEAKEAYAKKSISYPLTLMAKHDLNPKDDYKTLMAQVDTRDDLSTDERLALKFEIMNKFKK